jgi:cytochrome c oxidase cbb3-type subunit 3
MSKVRDQVLGHAAESDGIEEYDNPLPDWWVGLFWLTIIWALAYSVHYHFLAHRSPAKALAAEVAEAQQRWPNAGKAATVALDHESIEEGEKIYKTNCAGCHGPTMTGGIGPNLLDSTWIHGGTPAEIVKTITEGVPAKGMLTWGPILGPEKIGRVAAYVISRNHEALGITDSDHDADGEKGEKQS